MNTEKVVIIGAGPCGLSCAIELQNVGINPLIIEKNNIVNTIYHFPTHQTFFSSSERLEIGEVPFITENKKPVRNQALAYYREVATRKKLRINTYEQVIKVDKLSSGFRITTSAANKENTYLADKVIIATGYYDQPNYMQIPGEELDKVMHYFKEPHPYYNKDVIVIGGKNSAVDATLELHKAGARVTVIYRGSEYSKSVKPWILPEFDSLIRNNYVDMYFDSHVTEITQDEVYFTTKNEKIKLRNDFVFAMTGYRPDTAFLEKIGVTVDKESGKPIYKEDTYETNIPGIFVAGVVVSGFNNNAIFIENGRFHGQAIAKEIVNTISM
ncbi:YpdA family putative bacillithiol disulfide reductase [Oceanobacillus bengalensis]|uniref:YpdA family putative bacillithiol disulfide reductase n=1 Tax=Oceanobacillus bengalensis TaxID=1435466 RepID=A0A494Z0Y7_9BACI|nr:YpdA family putative bacillithiol disulfide reductase [Oceanobacillus bengalensis]RKQ16124.1 YpdA family putative bacillithiol disulfide reductase [Oceanobacillus bengalensis]